MKVSMENLPVSEAMSVNIILDNQELQLIENKAVQRFLKEVIKRDSYGEAIRVLSVMIVEVYRQQVLNEAIRAINAGEKEDES